VGFFSWGLSTPETAHSKIRIFLGSLWQLLDVLCSPRAQIPNFLPCHRLLIETIPSSFFYVIVALPLHHPLPRLLFPYESLPRFSKSPRPPIVPFPRLHKTIRPFQLRPFGLRVTVLPILPPMATAPFLAVSEIEELPKVFNSFYHNLTLSAGHPSCYFCLL